MLEALVLVGFAVALIGGIILQLPLYASLFVGFCLFSGYGIYKGHSVKEVFKMAVSGLKTIGPVLVLFVIIGMLTASWRAAGTIPAITCWSSKIVRPSSLIVLAFLLSCAMGLATGSAFATAATIGVICMTIGRAMGADASLLGGAILSGCFFGDRCSPVSSSAMLTATLTDTDPYHNLNRMMRTSVVPFAATTLIFTLLGLNITSGQVQEMTSLFIHDFVIDWYVILPTLVIIGLSLMKVSVKKSMIASLITAIIIALVVQKFPLWQLPGLLIFGFHSQNQNIAAMVNGGGILSMSHLCLIIGLASTYSGLFRGTGLLDGLHDAIVKLSRKSTAFTGVLLTSLLTTGIACDQMLSIMLTYQLCDEVEADGKALALDLLNSSSIVCALMPWTTSCMGCLAFIGGPVTSSLFAFFPMLMPLWFLFLSIHERRNPEFIDSRYGKAMGFDEVDDVRRFLDEKGKLNIVQKA